MKKKITDFKTSELTAELDRRAKEPVDVYIDAAAEYARVIGYDPKRHQLLHQNEKWIDGAGIHWFIKEMETSHIYNLLQWLRNRVQRLKLCEEFSFAFSNISAFPMGDAAQDAMDSEQQYLMEMDAVEWFDSLPLVKALREEFGKRTAA